MSWHKKRADQGAGSGTSAPVPQFGPLIGSVQPVQLESEAKKLEKVAVATEFKTVASFNWLNKKEPTIMIPGKPPRWTPLTTPRGLREDSGTYFRDINSAHHPKHPMEPVVLAGMAMDSNLPQQVDIVACGSTLGNLLRFIRYEDRSFRILAEDIGGTVFLVRRENSPQEVIQDVRGYGHSFPEAYTTWDPEVQRSVSHQRLIHYRFGGLNLLVRFEADGYIAEGSAKSDVPAKAQKKTEKDMMTSADQLTQFLATTGLSQQAPNSAMKVQVSRGGQLIDQSLIFDLKTRSAWKKETEDTLAAELPRLWIAQVPKFVLAYHERGVFKDISIRPVRAEVKRWEKEHKQDLSRLAALLHRITALLRGRPDCKIELSHQAAGVLEVREQLADAGDALSPAVRKLWEKGLSQDGTQPEEKENKIDVFAWEDGGKDYTACSFECDYCGRCTY